MTKLNSLLIAVAFIAGIVGCAQPAQYNLTISSTEGGKITAPGDGTFSYDEGTEVPLGASPHTGYCFVSWTGDVDGIADVEDATTTITINDDYSITANFAAVYDLTIASTAGGSVISPGEGIFSCCEGTDVELEAVADEGYLFEEWTGDVDTIADVADTTTTITMNGDYVITAKFEMAGWVRNPANGHYYKLTEKLTWPSAEAQAVTWGGHLVTINDEAEELWLRSTFDANESFWIGFNDIAIEGVWEWVSGEPVTWTNWDEGEPTNAGYPNITNEDVAVMNETPGSETRYGWNDVPETRLDRGIVEAPEKASP